MMEHYGTWEYEIGAPPEEDITPYEHRVDAIRELIECSTGIVLGWRHIRDIQKHIRDVVRLEKFYGITIGRVIHG